MPASQMRQTTICYKDKDMLNVLIAIKTICNLGDANLYVLYLLFPWKVYLAFVDHFVILLVLSYKIEFQVKG